MTAREIRTTETTDGRYVKSLGYKEMWWDTTGIELVDWSVVEEYLYFNPGVGIRHEISWEDVA